MQDAETRALRRALVILLLVSAARWIGASGGRSGPTGGASVLGELTEAVDEATREQERRRRPLAGGERIDPNRAEAVELDRLPGIGPATAEAIVAAREAGVVFRRPEDLAAVRGIGPRSVERITPHLELSRPPRPGGHRARDRGPGAVVQLNRASLEELETLPGVGPAIAARIVERRRSSPFRTVEELLEVRGIGPATLERVRDRVRVAGAR